MLEMLVDRLRWPAAMVRERAASQLGILVSDGYPGAREALLDWIESQMLESLAAIGLLPFIYAAARSGVSVTHSAELTARCKSKSVLSEMYLNHLDPSHQVCVRVGQHSGAPPDSWELPIATSEQQTLDLESVCRSRLEMLEGFYNATLAMQFEYELHCLRALYGESTRRAFWAQGGQEKGFHPGWHTLSHEICLSAYLRTLAWSAANEILPDDEILDEAASLSPIDLALWHVQPGAKPDWWPTAPLQNSLNETDSLDTGLMHSVGNLAGDWGAGPMVLLAAGGSLVETTLRRQNLEIRSCFQSSQGPSRPTSQDLFEYLNSVKAFVYHDDSPLGFSGRIKIDTGPRLLSDWRTVPCTGISIPKGGNIWQAWRSIRGIHSPSHLLANGELHAECREDSIDFQDSDGLVARWTDWSEGVSAIFFNGTLPANGWMLVAPHKLIDALEEKAGMHLAWVWEITSHFRSSTYDEFKDLRMYGESGTSLVIHP